MYFAFKHSFDIYAYYYFLPSTDRLVSFVLWCFLVENIHAIKIQWSMFSFCSRSVLFPTNSTRWEFFCFWSFLCLSFSFCIPAHIPLHSQARNVQHIFFHVRICFGWSFHTCTCKFSTSFLMTMSFLLYKCHNQLPIEEYYVFFFFSWCSAAVDVTTFIFVVLHLYSYIIRPYLKCLFFNISQNCGCRDMQSKIDLNCGFII